MASDVQGPWEGLTIGNGRYRNLTTIGVGGMGYVYRAVDGNLNSDVVIKSPRASMLEDRIVAERFEREIGAMVKLSFPHIVKVMDVGLHEGIAFAVMPFLSGGNLYKRMVLGTDGTPAPLAWRTMRGWLPNVAAALDFVHRSRYVHRDVKPQNILFDRYSLAYLSDFGIVKAVGLTVGAETRFQTSEGFNAGTIDYMSPEILTAQRFDGRADQYSLAVTVYQYLTGVLPFASESIVVTIDRHLHLTPKLAGDLVAGIPPHVSAAIARALSKAPADRFPDCTQFIRTLLAEPPAGAVAQSVNTAAVASDSTGNLATSAAPAPAAPKPATPRSAPAETVAGFSLAPPVTAPPPASAASQRPSSAPNAATQSAPRVPSGPSASSAASSSPSQAAAPSRPVGGAETARIPAFKPPVQGRAKFWKSAAPWQRIAVVVSLLGIAATICVGAVLTFDTDLPPSTGLDTNHLPRLIDDWKKQATEVERVAVIDSKAMLEKLEYSDRKELEQLLDAAGTKAPPDVTAAINTLEIDLTTLARVHQARSEQLHLLRDAAKKSPQTDPKTLERFEVEDTELKDQGTQLVAMAHRLKTLRDSTQLPRSAYDAPAMAELRLLDDMERIVAAEEPVEIESATMARAETLASERNPDLAWRALNVLARSPTLAHVQVAVHRLNTFTPERRAELAYSLLISGQADAIVAATRLLRDDAEVRGRLKRDRLLHLAELNPSRYQDLVSPLAATSITSDDRFRIFCVQAPAMRDDWSIDVEKACSEGLLRDRTDEVVIEIIDHKLRKAYPLAERLLTKSRDLPLHRFTGEELKPLVAEAPAIASVLAEQWVLRGTPPLRKAALSAYTAPASALDKLRLRKVLSEQKLADPTSLVNMLLVEESTAGVDLAELVLVLTHDMALGKVDYTAASTALLHKPGAVKVLQERAWKEGESGRTWALGQLLGADYVRRVHEIQEARDENFRMLTKIMPILGGTIVVLPNSRTLGKPDRGLQVEMKDLIRLPKDVDPLDWAPDGDQRKRLALLRGEVASLKTTSSPTMVEALQSLDLYLVELESLVQTCYEIAGIYDLTVTKQLPGAYRELKLAKLEAWDFRYSSVLIASYERENAKYKVLQNSIPLRRAAVPLP